MGDVMSLVEKAEENFEKEEQEILQKKFKANAFTLEDFCDQLKQIQKMGSMEQLLGMIPGAGKLKGLKIDNKAFVQIEAIINSMTPKERVKHNIINASRKRRIAQGSGTRVNDINKLLKQFVQMQKMMKKVSRGGGLNLGSLMGSGGFLGRWQEFIFLRVFIYFKKTDFPEGENIGSNKINSKRSKKETFL